MAYAFSSIDELLNGQQQQSQTDIFGTPTQPLQGATPQGEQNPTKTVAEGESGGTPTNTQASGSSGPVDPVSSTQQADRAAITANVGKTAKPKALDDISRALQTNEQRLQAEADSYVAQEKSEQNYAVDNATIDNAIKPSRDTNAFSNVMGLLNRSTINDVDRFKASDTRVADVDMLKNSAGLKSLAARGQDPMYSRGMAAFDVRALQATPGFNAEVNSLQAKQNALNLDAANRGDSLYNQVQDYGKSQLASAKDAARGYLGSQSSSMLSANEAEAKAYNDALAALDLNAIANNEVRTKALEDVKAELQQINPLAVDFLDPTAVSYSNYITRGANRGAGDFISNDEAARYNNILALLGDGGQQWTASQAIPDAAKNYSVDYAAIEDLLKKDALYDYNNYYNDTKSQMDAVIRDAQRLADQKDMRLLGDVRSQAQGDWLSKQADELAKGLDPELAAYYQPNLLKASNYLTDAPALQDLGWRDVLTQTDADKLNEMARKIGLTDTYNAGGFKDPSIYRFNKDSYLADLTSKLTERKAAGDARKKALAEEEQRRKEERLRQQLKDVELEGNGVLVHYDGSPLTEEEKEYLNWEDGKGPKSDTQPNSQPDIFSIGGKKLKKGAEKLSASAKRAFY